MSFNNYYNFFKEIERFESLVMMHIRKARGNGGLLQYVGRKFDRACLALEDLAPLGQ